MNEVVLHDVPMDQVRAKVRSHEELFDHEAEVFISGTFVDAQGEPTFLERGFYRVDLSVLPRNFLLVNVSGEWISLRPVPEGGPINQVKISSTTSPLLRPPS